MKIIRAVQTCIACPSQWDLWDEEGNYYYARFRHGCGELRQYKDENWVDAPWKPEEEIDKTVPGWGIYANTHYVKTIATFQDEDEWNGFIELDEFCQRAGVELDLTMYTNYGEHLRDGLVQEGFTFLIEDKP